jgi:hypothetical protein
MAPFAQSEFCTHAWALLQRSSNKARVLIDQKRPLGCHDDYALKTMKLSQEG